PGEQTRLEPPPVLVRALEVHVRLALRLRPARPAVEPDVHGVRAPAELPARERGRHPRRVARRVRAPRINTPAPYRRDDVVDRLVAHHSVALRVVQHGYGHPPRALPRDAPLAAALDEALQARPAAGGDELDVLERGERVGLDALHVG